MSDARALSAALLVAGALAAIPAAGAAQDWRTTTMMRQRGGEDALAVDLEYGAGSLTVQPGDDNALYRANLRYDAERFQPITDYRPGRLRIGMDSHEGLNLRDHDTSRARLDLSLARGVPLDLDFSFGAAEADVELGGLTIQKLKVSTGASRTNLRFSRPNPSGMETLEFEVGAAEFEATGLGSAHARELKLEGGVADVTLGFDGEWTGDAHLEVEMGLGSLTLRVPRDVGLRIRKDTFLASIDAPRMSKDGDVYVSDNWGQAEHKLSVEVDAAFGSISVDWID